MCNDSRPLKGTRNNDELEKLMTEDDVVQCIKAWRMKLWGQDDRKNENSEKDYGMKSRYGMRSKRRQKIHGQVRC